MPRSLMQALSQNNAGAVVAVAGQVTNAVAGTRSTHTHGLTDHMGKGRHHADLCPSGCHGNRR